MSPMRILCVLATLLAVCGASPSRTNTISGSRRPTNSLTANVLDNTPCPDEITLIKLEEMSLEDGAYCLRKLYHKAQINYTIKPDFVPNKIPVRFYDINTIYNLENFDEMAKNQHNFSKTHITIFITGLPPITKSIKQANIELIQTYRERFKNKQEEHQRNKNSEEKTERLTSSEERTSEWNQTNDISLIVIDLGEALINFNNTIHLNIPQTGKKIGGWILELMRLYNIRHDIIHIVSQYVSAHVAGVIGEQLTNTTGNKYRRITALSPTRIYATDPNAVGYLSRGKADFIDAIHTSTNGMGTRTNVGDVDFFPYGPGDGVPGDSDVIEAAIRATRYFLQTLRPRNEYNFPALPGNSMSDIGHGRIAFMGIAVDHDIKGNYIWPVNEHSTFGNGSLSQK